ncbi:hypothetical protein KUV65_17985 [Maritalea mobilis]|uniref:hypothetical protein n=1 Tax=Maritalea mobilis TaxID=483324 RepID=UPI001C972583|nr:hypothetical protein [Maritalea mobilis]MBY6203257.1 hypothetical protein [Maritalea mobilis]
MSNHLTENDTFTTDDDELTELSVSIEIWLHRDVVTVEMSDYTKNESEEHCIHPELLSPLLKNLGRLITEDRYQTNTEQVLH